jgi:hypothetical protein
VADLRGAGAFFGFACARQFELVDEGRDGVHHAVEDAHGDAAFQLKLDQVELAPPEAEPRTYDEEVQKEPNQAQHLGSSPH